MNHDNFALIIALVVVLCTILVFFIVNTLKKIDKIDNIVRLEEKLLMAIKSFDETAQEVKKLFGKSISFDQELIQLKGRITKVENVLDEFSRSK